MTKAGGGTLTLNGANLFTGGVTLNAGVVSAGNATALGPAANATVVFGNASTGKLQLNGNSVTVVGLNSDPTVVGSPTVEDGVAGTHTLTVSNTSDNVFAGVLQNGSAGTLALVKKGPGVLSLGGNNTFGGATTVSAGTIAVGHANALGSSGSITLGDANSGTSALGLTVGGGVSFGRPFTVAAYGGGTTFGGTNTSGTASFAGAITLNTNAVLTAGAGGTVEFNTGGISGGFGLTKVGAGTVMMDSANTYSAGTAVSNGTLLANCATGSGTGAGAVTVTTGGSLGGTGIVAGAVSTVSAGTGTTLNGHLAPGSGGPGVLTISNTLTVAANSFFDVDLNQPNITPGTGSNDLLSVKGANGTSNGHLTIGTNVNVQITAGPNFAAGTYPLITFNGTLTNNSNGFAGWSGHVVNGSDNYAYTFGADATSVYLNVAAAIIATLPATNVQTTAADLNGYVSSTGVFATVVRFYWTTNAALTNTYSGWNGTNEVLNVNTGSLSRTVTSLQTNTTYYYQFYATNAAGEVWSGPLSFTTRMDTTIFGTRMQVTFPGYAKSETLTNFPVLIVLGPQSTNGFSYTQFASTNGWDLRFAPSDETRYLNYEIEKWNPTSNSYIWVQVPQMASNATIWAYWGNPALTSAPPAYSTNGATWADGGLAVWHMKDFTDSTSNRNVCSSPAVPSLVGTGRIAGCELFNGTTQYLTNQTGAINLGARFTLSAWLNVNDSNGSKTFLASRSPGNPGFAAYVNGWGTSNKMVVFETSQGQVLTATNLVTTGVWHHVAVSVRTNASTTVYVDGVQQAYSAGNNVFDNNRMVYIGCFADGEARFADSMDEVRLENVDRSSNWVWACTMNQGATPGFVAYSAVSSPVIANAVVSNVTAATATLNGQLSLTGGLPTHVYAFWGSTDGGMSATAWANTNDLAMPTTGVVSTAISSLSQTSTYYYAFYARNTLGWCWTPTSSTFTTLVAGAIGATSATSITPFSATMGGNLATTNAAPNHVFVLWGPANAGPQWGGWAHTNDVGTQGTGSFATPAAGLAASTTYYYTCAVTNPAGTVWAAASATFVTAPDWRAWSHRMKIPFSGFNNNTPLTNFPALILLGTNLSGFAYSQFASANGWDLRFSDASETVTLNYEIESWSTATNSPVWVQVPLIRTNTDFIWAYWGNPAATQQPAFTTNGAAWDASFRGVWHMGQTNAWDSTTNVNNGVSSNNTTVVGCAGNAQRFNNNGEINCGNGPSLNLTNLTISGWFNLSQPPDTWDTLIGKGADTDYELEFAPGIDRIRLRIKSDGATGPTNINSLVPGVWYFAAGTYDGASATANLYLNGILQSTRTAATPLTSSTAGNVTLGHRAGNPGFFYSGLLDEVRIESAPRSADWVTACYQTVASNATFTPIAAAMTYPVQTLAATNVQAIAAWLNGSLASTGTAPATVRFYWTTNPSLTNTFSGWNGFADVTDVGTGAMTAQATGLLGSTTYYVQCYATNNDGQWWGAQTTFTTLVAAVVDDNVGAAAITERSATLQGNLTATNVAPTRVFALYGPTNAGAQWGGWAYTNDLGTPPVGPLSTAVSGLAQTSTYYYVFVATNIAGTVWAPSIANFITRLDMTAFGSRMPITFPDYTKTEPLTNFPALVTFGPSSISGFSYNQFASTNGWDLRFTTGDGTQFLNYDVEKWNPAGNSYVWVQVPQFTNGATIWAYWGNPATASTPAPYTTNGATWSTSLAVWHMKDAALPLTDSTSNRNSCTSSIGPTYTAAGQIGGAESFNGTSQYVTNQTGPMNLGGHFTISAWVNVPGSVTAGQVIFSTRTTGGDSGVALYVNDYGNGNRQLTFEGSSKIYTATNLVTGGLWHHVAAVVNGVGSSAALYVDGTNYLSGGAIGTIDSNRVVYLGRFTGGVDPFTGLMDEVRVDTVERSSNWVWACAMNQGADPAFVSCGTVSSPVITNSGSANVTAEAAVLNGYLSSTGGLPTHVYAYWGTANGGMSAPSWANTNDLGLPLTGSVSTAIGGLSQTTTYYYTFFATNVAGWCWAPSSATVTTLVAGVIGNGSGATNITATAADLSGTLSATNASASRVFVLWGPVSAGAQWTGWAYTNDLGSRDIGPFVTSVSGLTPSAPYYYVCVATNPAGTFWAAAVTSFTTRVSTMIDNNGGASAITIVSATLNGNLTFTGAAPNHVYAFWGPTDGGAAWGGWAHTNDLGICQVGPLSAGISGLSALTTYYYTYLATNPAGAAWAPSSASFVTHLDTRNFKWRSAFSFAGYTKSELLTNFPALVVIGPSVINGFAYEQFASANGWDLRFMSSDLTQTLNYEVEKWDPSGNSYVWVQVPALSSNASIWVYWGNAAAASQPADYTTNGATWTNSFAVWHLKDAVAPFADSTINRNDAISGTVPTPTSGVIAGGQRFNGTSQYLTNRTGAVNLGDRFTLSAWINVSGILSGVGSRSILASKTSGGGAGFAFFVNDWLTTNQTLVFEGQGQVRAVANTVTTGVWHHVAVSVRTNAYTAVYMDGVQQGFAAGNNVFDNNRTIYMGRFENPVAYFADVMDEVRVESVDRSSNWVWACWMNQGSNTTFESAANVECMLPHGAVFTFR